MAAIDSKKANEIAAFGIGLLPLSLFFYRVLNGIPYFGAVNDLPEYSTAARLVLAGQAGKIYRLPEFFAAQTAQFPMLGSRNVALFLPPLDVPLLLPVALIPDAVAPMAWIGILFTALVSALILLKRCFDLSLQHFCWFFGLTVLSGPCIESVRIGQLSPFLLLCLVGTNLLVSRGKPMAAGIVFSLMLLKPQQMWPLMIFFLGARQYGLMKAVVGVMVILGLASFAIFGVSGYLDYLHTVQDPANISLMAPALNATLRGQLLLVLGTNSVVPNVIALAALVCSTAFVFLLGRRSSNNASWFDIGLVGALPIGLVTSMHCHDYDLLLLVPSLLALFARPLFGQPRLWSAAQITGLLCVVLFSQPVYGEIHYNYLCQGGIVNPYFFILFAFGILCSGKAWRVAGE